SFWLAGFVDMGNVYPLVSDMSLGDLRYTAGMGLRYKSAVGPLRVDVGYKLNHRPEDTSTYHVHFTIGHAFLGPAGRAGARAGRARGRGRGGADPGRGERPPRAALGGDAVPEGTRRRPPTRFGGTHRRAAHVPRGGAPAPGRGERCRGGAGP